MHKGDVTGIEIVSRLAEQVWASGAERLEDTRAIALIPDREGARLAGVLAIDMRSGALVHVAARAVQHGAHEAPRRSVEWIPASAAHVLHKFS